jgi:hypothetical protein
VGYHTRRQLTSVILIALLSLFSAFSIPRIWATEIFSDGFESGDFTAWTGTGTNGLGTITVVSSQAHHGIYSAEIAGETVDDAAGMYKDTATAISSCNFRFYVKLTAFSPNDGDYVRLWGITTLTGWYFMQVGLRDSTRKLFLRYYDSGQAGAEVTSATTLALNTWYCVELEYVRGVSGSYKVYLNGVEVSDLTQSLATDFGDGNIRIKIENTGARSYSGGMTFYSDCVVFADAYIGPEVSGQNLTFSLYENPQTYASTFMGKEKPYTLYETAIGISSIYSGKEKLFTLPEVAYTYALPLFSQEHLFQLPELAQAWATVKPTFEGVAVSITFILMETAHAIASKTISTALAVSYATKGFVLAAMILLAIFLGVAVPILLVATRKRR